MKNLTEGEKMVCRDCGCERFATVKPPVWMYGHACPFCGNSDDEKFIKKGADESFGSRTGCLICNKWLEPIALETAKEVLK